LHVVVVGVLRRLVGDFGLRVFFQHQGPQPADPRHHATAGGAFAHRCAKLVRDVCAVAVLNREIHTDTYNALIGGILRGA
jgi:hypothetical protein